MTVYRRVAFLFVLMAWIGLTSWACRDDVAWPAVLYTIETEYPDVTRITTDSLAAWMTSDSVPAPLLLDVRTSEEFAISHLQGARRIDPDARDLSALEGLDRNTPIVAYCSIGYRSSEMAARLQDAGYTNVYNLEGSIFRWANEGRPVYRAGREVRDVHPYDGVWGRLLDRRLRSVEPRDP